MDFSDDDEEENVVNLASPDPPSRLFVDSKHHTEHLTSEKKNLNFEEIKKDTSVACQDNGRERNSSGIQEVSGNKGSNIFLQPKTENHVSEELADKIQKDMVSPAATSPQRRKVLKTWVDERGREGIQFYFLDLTCLYKYSKHFLLDGSCRYVFCFFFNQNIFSKF